MKRSLNLIPAEISGMYGNGIKVRKKKGLILIADISGFTVMTEELIKSGKIGCEILSEIINEIFEPAIAHIYENNGYISSFAGDSFTAVFAEGDQNKVIKAAEGIRTLFAENTFRERKLDVKISVGAGSFYINIIPSKNKVFYLYKGQAVDRSIESQLSLKKNSIGFMPDDINSVCSSKIKLSEIQEINQNSYRAFIDEAVLKIAKDMKGEFREVVTVFMICSVYSKNRIAEIADKTYECGGFLQKIDYGDKGIILLAVFGAPVSLENKEKSALGLLDIVKGKDMKTGISKGVVFAGFIGSGRRAEYTCLGSMINLSARLAGSALKGQVICDERFKTAVENIVTFIPLKGIKLKGIDKGCDYFLLDNLHTERQKDQAVHVFGREKEYDRFGQIFDTFKKEKISVQVKISGAAGTGKTVFLNSLIENIITPVYGIGQIIYIDCDLMKRPFYNIQTFLKIRNITGLKRKRKNELKNLGYFFEESIKFILGETTDNKDYEKLDTKNKFSLAISNAAELMLSTGSSQPLFIIFDSAQNREKTLESLIQYLIKSLHRKQLFIIMAERTADDNLTGQESVPKGSFKIDLSPFSDDRTKIFAEKILGTKITRDLGRKIFVKTKGVPLYIEYVCDYLANRGFSISERGYAVFRDENIESLNSMDNMLVSFVDSLSEIEKAVIRTASVIGEEFSTDVLMNVSAVKRINGCIDKLVEKNIFRIRDGIIRFANPLLKNSVYETILRKDALAIHKKTADYLAGSFYADYKFIAGHYEMALDSNKAKEFYKRSLEISYKAFRNEEAYESLIAFMRLNPADEDMIELLCRYPEIFHLNSQFEKGIEIISAYENKTGIDLTSQIILKNILGQLYSSKQKLDASIAVLTQALEISEKIGDKSNTAFTYLNLGNTYTFRFEYNKAEEYLAYANKLGTEKNLYKIILKSLNNLGVIYTYKSDFIKAAKMFDDLNIMAEKHGDIYDILTSLVNIGFSNLYTNEYQKSENALVRALGIAKDLNEKSKMTIILGNLGNLYELKSDFHKALDYFKELLIISEELDDIRNLAVSHGNIGYIYIEQGRFRDALPHIEKQKYYSEKCGDKRHLLYAHQSLGKYYLANEDYDNAYDSFSKQYEIASELDDKINMNVSRTNLVNINEQRYNYGHVEAGYKELIADSLVLGDRRGEGQGYYTLANFYIKTGKFSECNEYLNKLKFLADELDNDEFKMKYIHLRALLFFADNKPDQAENEISKLFEYANEKNANVYKIESYSLLAELSYIKKDIHSMSKYISGLSELRSYETDKQHNFDFNLLKALLISLSEKQEAVKFLTEMLKNEILASRLGRINKELYLLTAKEKFNKECRKMLSPIYEKSGDIYLKEILDK